MDTLTNARYGIFTLLALALVALAGACAAPQAPDLVQWKVEQSNAYMMAGESGEQVVNVEIGAKLPSELEAHIPLNISLVLDHSGSMNGEQMDDAKRAIRYMLGQLKDDDMVSVIAFSTQVEIILPQTEWDDVDRNELFASIDELQPRGTTAMYEALYQAYSEVSSHYNEGSINRVMLLSDGIPNDATNLVGLAQTARGSNIPITTMGLGPYYNEDLMAQLADTSGGNYRFIKESDEIEEFFLAEKRSMEQVVARNLTLTFNLGPGAELQQTLGGQASLNGRQVSVYLGDLSVSDPRQIAVKLNVAVPSSGARVEILDAHLSWEDVIGWSGTHEAWAYVEALSTKDQALIEQNHNKVVVEKVGRLHAAWEMERAIRDYQAGNRREAQERLQRAASDYKVKKKEASAWRQKLADVPAEQNAPTPVMSGAASSFDYSDDQIVGSQDLDSYMEKAAEELEEAEPESDEGKIIIKSVKSRNRLEQGD